MKLSKFIFAGIAALAMLFTSCEKPKEEKEATAITLSQTEVTLNDVTPAVELSAALTPSDATNTISWSSSDEAVVTVVSSGSKTAIVTGVGKGTATVTATTSNGLAATCAVTADVTVVALEPMPEVANPAAGFTTIALRAPEGTCNGVIMVGAGFGENCADDWSPESKNNSFTKVEGTETWYTITVPYCSNLAGKACAVADDNTSSWSYQWGRNATDDGDNVTILQGAGEFELENATDGKNGEPKMSGFADGAVVYVDVKSWQMAPCAPKNPAGTATFTMTTTVPLPEGAEVGIVGNLAVGDWDIANVVVMSFDGTTYTATVDVKSGCQYKYAYRLTESDEWSWDNMEDGGNRVMDVSNNAVDVVTEWAGVAATGGVSEGTGTFTITVTAGYVTGSDIIFTGNFATESWGDSQRTMTSIGNNKWTWTGDYPANFAFKVIMRKAGADDVWASGSNVIFDGETFEHSFAFPE
ncbi:MAG: Ig-like domain-containing protein [Bacteroidales bacterium]|jgi:hypothetical protein|nr:Ig-like domain-containing protein [Bacteroidales bacterium]